MNSCSGTFLISYDHEQIIETVFKLIINKFILNYLVLNIIYFTKSELIEQLMDFQLELAQNC